LHPWTCTIAKGQASEIQYLSTTPFTFLPGQEWTSGRGQQARASRVCYERRDITLKYQRNQEWNPQSLVLFDLTEANRARPCRPVPPDQGATGKGAGSDAMRRSCLGSCPQPGLVLAYLGLVVDMHACLAAFFTLPYLIRHLASIFKWLVGLRINRPTHAAPPMTTPPHSLTHSTLPVAFYCRPRFFSDAPLKSKLWSAVYYSVSRH
jgi:hypothetical protein